ncbi:MAG: hypothetical protein LBP62_02995 [Clostridiales bacterium]|jgi:cell division protein FtsA|nr:hypothetical protein [Clostridiales bacterium]
MPKNSETAVLDVGSGKIRAAIAVKNSKISVEVRGIGEVDYAGYRDGKFFNTENLKEAVLTAVSKAEASAGSKIKKLFVGVPAEFTYSVCREPVIVFERETKITNDEIAALLKKNDRFDNDDEFITINRSPVFFLLDDDSRRLIEPRGLTAGKIKALISYVRCQNDFIGEIGSILEGRGIELEFTSSVLAEVLYLFDPEERDRYVLFADAGYISSEVAFLRGDGLLHLASFSMGGAHIAADVSEIFQIPFNEAENIVSRLDLNNLDEKVNIKTESGEISGKDMRNVVTARLAEFADVFKIAVKSSLTDCPVYVTMHLSGGGLSYLKGAKEFLAEALGREVKIIAPNLPQYNKPHYSALFGLIDTCGSLDGERARKTKKGFFGRLFGKKTD